MSKPVRLPGFTIVELLITVVVIAIIAALTVVAFNGIQNRAAIAMVEDGVKQTARALEAERASTGNYPGSLGGLTVAKLASDSKVAYQYTGTDTSYCLTGTYEKIIRHVSNTSPNMFTEGACPGHTAPRTGPLSIVHTQVGEFSGARSSTFTIPLSGSVSNGDLIFIVFNHDNVNTLTNVALDGTPMTNTLAKQSISGRPTTGRQATAAYSAQATSSSPSITISGTSASPSAWSDAYGRYAIYVIRGFSSAPMVSSAHTAYGDQPLNTVLETSPLPVGTGDIVIMSDVYYSYAGSVNYSDASSPSLAWTTASTRSSNSAMSFPGTSSNALSVRHTVTAAAGTASYRMTMPSSGTASYQGAGMAVFTIR